MRIWVRNTLLAFAAFGSPFAIAAASDPVHVATDLVLAPGATLDAPLVIVADGVTIDGNGATIVGPGAAGDLEGRTGVGVELGGRRGVTIKNLTVRGFEIGLKADDCEGLSVLDCDFSDNFHDPEHGWGDGGRNGGVILTGVSKSRIVGNRANHVWNGIDLFDCDDNEIVDNDFSHCSNVCLKLWRSCRNRIVDNDLSWGLRIREGEVHARDSTSVLIETGSDDNHFLRNDCTHGGDGIFIRPLNAWLSTGNLFEENDCSYANNNGFESWSPGNTFLRNKANHCSYGFWLGSSDRTVLIGNEASYNGRPEGFHNAPEPDFRHGGIVIVNGSGTHTLIQDNDCHYNNGGGIVFRGDLGSRGDKWRMEHLVVQGNRLTHNQWGLFARFTTDLYLAGNVFGDNEEDEHLEDVLDLRRGAGGGAFLGEVKIDGPTRVIVGDEVMFVAQADAGVTAPRFHWRISGVPQADPSEGRRVRLTFREPGFHRISLTADDGRFAALASHDVLAVEEGDELGTEGGAALFVAIQGGEASLRGRVSLVDDPTAVVGTRSLRVRPDPYAGAEVIVTREWPAATRLTDRHTLSFWLRFRNPNYGFDGPTLVRLHTDRGMFTYVPVAGPIAGGRPLNLLRDHPYPEARDGWQRVSIPLAGDDRWRRTAGSDGPAPPRYAGDLEITTLVTNVETQDSTAMASDGASLYLATVEGDRLFRSADGALWEELPSPRRQLGTTGDWINGMLAFHRASDAAADAGGLYLRMRNPELDPIHGVAWSRVARFDLATGAWGWLPTRMGAGHGSVVVGDSLFAIAHALGANYGGAIERVDLTDPPAVADRSAHAKLLGPDGWWLSRAAQLATVDGVVYAIKNDWTTPAPEASGDRLFAFDPSEYRPSTFLGGHPWSEDQWEAAQTPVDDILSLPMEVGHGAAMVGLPPGWSGAIGPRGGLFIIAGSSPSNHEGQGTPSSRFVLYDIQQREVTAQGELPDPTGSATSAVFHDGKVFIKRGGMNFPASNAELWVVRPVPADEAARGRAAARVERVRLQDVNRISFQFDSNGNEPFDVWIDGLRVR